MAGITLSADDIRSAPPEVRHWIEHLVVDLLRPDAAAEAAPIAPGLAACSAEEVRAILAQVQNLLPVVSVLFELGRETPGATIGRGIRALALADIQRHARLRVPEQVVQCLDVINQVLAAVRGKPDAMVAAYDAQGRCLVSEATAHSILAVWHDIVAARDLEPAAAPAAAVAGNDPT